MGIEIHGLNFLRLAKRKKKFGDVLTIGRQGLYVIEPVVKELIATNASYKNQTYCEELFIDYFGATKVESIDNGSYEGATYLHDMNEPLPEALSGKFDTVIDGGCLEHIFNVPQALRNCSSVCRPGGQIIHILPANNFCGHGFWQFSPELFFSLYSEKNGYKETEIYLADESDSKKWYRVSEPRDGNRVNVMSRNSLHLLVRTVLATGDFSHKNIQQSDYVHKWEEVKEAQGLIRAPSGLRSKITKALKGIPFTYKLLSSLHTRYFRALKKGRLNDKNPGLSPIRVISAIGLD